MPDHFDAIVVGSGFGGSVMAYRLAQAKQSVCVLERGKKYPPGSFPRTPDAMSRNFWAPRYRLQGLLDLWSFRHLGAVVASGLGGGSLIYANVHIRKDPKWFIHEPAAGGYEVWPVTREQLDPHYKNVETMLDVQPYPYAETTPKTRALQFAAAKLQKSGKYEPGELEWLLPNLAVSFGTDRAHPMPGAPVGTPEQNLHRMPRSSCRSCGECNIGCNYGSKNTLDYNYLSRAEELGAELWVQREVKLIEKQPAGYKVTFIDHSDESLELDKRPRQSITCSKLIMAAGAIGTPYLLLKNQKTLGGFNQNLGTRFNGNGDILGLAKGCAQPMAPSQGPVITSALRVADTADGGLAQGRGFYLEDAGFPAFLQWMAVEADAPSGVQRAAHFVKNWLEAQVGWGRHSNVSKDFADLIGDGSLPARILPLLGMGREIPSGTMSLTDDGDLDVDWSVDTSHQFFERVRRVMTDVSSALGGKFTDDPVWFLARSITVHPLGGCPMGDDARGFVNDAGKVYGHDNLYVADGSVMPGAVGPNPALTIAALADRFADRLLQP